MKTHTLKVTGVSEDLLRLLDTKIIRGHFAGRAEYIRALIRRDVLAGEREGPHNPFYASATPDEWIEGFMGWAQSHSLKTRRLSEEAVSRQSIYAPPRKSK